MIRKGIFVAACVALCLPATSMTPAFAQSDGNKVFRQSLREKSYEYVVPAGWTVKQHKDNELWFSPPRGKVKAGGFSCRVSVVQKDPKFRLSSSDLVKGMAQTAKDEEHPGWQTDEVSTMKFAGVTGSAQFLIGDDKRGVRRAIIFLVAVTSTDIYMLRSEGAFSDLSVVGEELDLIKNGFHKVSDAVADGTVPRGKPGGKETTRPTKTPPQPKKPAVSFDDPSWGVRLDKPTGNWELEHTPNSYVITAKGPAARVTFSRIPYTSRTRRKYSAKALAKKKGARVERFANVPNAIIVESRPKKSAPEITVYLPQKDGVVAINMSSFDFAQAKSSRLPAIARALSVTEAQHPSQARKRKGRIQATLPEGVTLDIARGWRLEKSKPGVRGLELSKGNVRIRLDTFGVPVSAAGWDATHEYAYKQCKSWEGKFSKLDMGTSVVNAKKTKRYECDIGGGDVRVITLTEGRHRGRPAFIRTRVYNGNSDGAALPEVAELFLFLKMGK